MVPHRRTAQLAAALACAAALTTGCGVDSVVGEGVERAIEEGAGGDADVDLGDDGSFSVENSDGSFQMGSDELPEGFPSDDVPLVDGSVLTSSRFAQGDDTVWSVTLQIDGDADAAFTSARDELVAAGYDETQAVDSDGFRSSSLEKSGLQVNLTGVAGSDGATLSYTVTDSAP